MHWHSNKKCKVHTTGVFMNRLIANTTINWNLIDLSRHGQTKTILTCDPELIHLAWTICNVALNLKRQNYRTWAYRWSKPLLYPNSFETYILGPVSGLSCKTTINSWDLYCCNGKITKVRLVWEILFLTGKLPFGHINIILITTFTVVLF